MSAPEVKTDTRLRRLVTGQTDYAFIRRSRTWALVSLAILLVAVGGVLLRGVDFSLEFTGGTAFTVEEAERDFATGELRDAVTPLVEGDPSAQRVQGPEGTPGALVSTPPLGEVGGEQEREVAAAIAEVTGVEAGEVLRDSVGPRWGEQVTEQALLALVVFLGAVSLYIALRFEWRMSAAAAVTLLHDVVVTIGVYALVGFQVSPASIIALLTILGYSLYDTVVVFDRVTEDARAHERLDPDGYARMANTALNRVLVRSLSTSATSLLPVGSLLLIGGNLLGADTLVDLALALFVGMAVGTYSSIFVATPLLVALKRRDVALTDPDAAAAHDRSAAVR